MKKLLFLSLLILFFIACDEPMANSCQTLQPEKVADGEFQTMPQFSPDGKSIAFTGQKNRGIFILTLKDKKILPLSNLQGEGYGFSFSPDGGYIATTVQNGLQGFAALYSVADGAQVWRSEARGRITSPVWSRGLPYWFNRSVNKLVVPKIQIRSIQNGPERPVTWTEMNKIMLSQNGQVAQLTDGYASQLSPDGTKVLFKRNGAIYIYDSETKKSKKIAVGDHPSWAPDSRSILFVEVKDDGERIVSSQLFSADITSGEKQLVFIDGDVIVLHPRFSPDKKMIVFADDKSGSIYVATLPEGGCK